jgi:uncharacterized iron-regulated membrane protein
MKIKTHLSKLPLAVAPEPKQVRRWIFQLHSWIGLGLGILFAIIGLTGSAIVFMHELDRQLHPALMQVQPQGELKPLHEMIAPAISGHSQLSLKAIQLPKHDSAPAIAIMGAPTGERLEIYVNPYTGKVLGERIWERSPLGCLHTLHYTLFAGKIGRIAVGVEGILLLIVTLTGILLWTGWRRLKSGWRVRWNSPQHLAFDLHNVGGFMVSLLLLILAVTGSTIVFLQMALAPAAAISPPPTSPPSLVGLESWVKTAQQAIPGAKVTAVEFAPDLQTVSCRLRVPHQQTGTTDLSTVEIDLHRGTAISVNPIVDPPPLYRFILTIVALHYGTFGGLSSRIAYVAIGLMPSLLMFTGFILWRKRKLRHLNEM